VNEPAGSAKSSPRQTAVDKRLRNTFALHGRPSRIAGGDGLFWLTGEESALIEVKYQNGLPTVCRIPGIRGGPLPCLPKNRLFIGRSNLQLATVFDAGSVRPLPIGDFSLNIDSQLVAWEMSETASCLLASLENGKVKQWTSVNGQMTNSADYVLPGEFLEKFLEIVPKKKDWIEQLQESGIDSFASATCFAVSHDGKQPVDTTVL
jgi:hypothetical protein